MATETELRGTRADLAAVLSRGKEGVGELLREKETAIRQLRAQLTLQVGVWREFQESLAGVGGNGESVGVGGNGDTITNLGGNEVDGGKSQ